MLIKRMFFLMKYKIIILAITLSLLMIFLLIINNLWLYLLAGILFLLFWLNNYVYKKTAYNAIHLFSSVGRNYKKLIIGEACDVKQIVGDEPNYIFFLSPGKRSIQITIELVKRLYSLLDEDSGELYIVLDPKAKDIHGVSVFDIPYLHDITLKSLDIQNKKLLCRFPLFLEPMASIKFLLNRSPHFKLIEGVFPSEDLAVFCKERNIIIHFYYKYS